AARHRASRPPLPRWRRATRRAAALIALATIGFLFTVAYRQVVMEQPERERNRMELIKQITVRKERTTVLAATAESLQTDVSNLRDAALSDPEQIEQLRQLEAATGTRKVTGDGVIVRISDGPDAAGNEKARILDYDLQQLVNALWVYGAEAVSINGRRLTSLTAIRKGGGIYVGDFPVASPYEITAIGPRDLFDRFSKSVTAQVYRDLQERPEYRFGFKISRQDDLVLPAAVLPELRFAGVPSAPSASPSPSPSGGGR
ncbi:DUF881 domain-containing protein, partial [Allorhizocola rhizosphaerae]|uniref:DUF881 domain-containing protein n=1 Tax=Allorhizocola rhizosphaerae TaxID=1872709 RepID=UPI0013C332C7